MKNLLCIMITVLSFSLSVKSQTNLTWDPGSAQTGTFTFIHSDTNAGTYLFEVTTTNTAASVGYWRTVLNVTSGEADLYISTSAGITTNSYTQKSDSTGSDRIVRSLSAGQTWYLLVAAEANSVWSLFAGDMHVKDLVWDPGTAQSGTEVYTHPNTDADSYLFRITTTNTANSLGFWRTVLNVSGGNADLYTDPNANIATNDYGYFSEQAGSDTIVQSLSAGQTKYILVEAEAGVSWSLFAGDIHLTELTWDPGTADAGTEVFNNLNTDGGAYYFKITTELPDLAAWRTALDVLGGEADIYLKQNALPYANSIYQSFTDSSTYAGDDGFTRYLSNVSGAGQEWYLLVQADAGSTWSLLSGDVYAEDLGALVASPVGSAAVVPPEGIRYYKTTIPADALAWRLWLQDAAGTTTLNEPFYIRQSLAPHPSSASYYDRVRTGQGLLVPDYLVPGSPSYYFVGIPGEPGDAFQLDSRKQEIVTVNYNDTEIGQSATGFLFKTYQISVPPEQIAWEVTALPVASTNPDMAVRFGKVPNAFNNDAFSEVSSATTSDSITLVPASLGNGSYYVTVYGDAPFNFDLRNREPIITQIDFNSTSTNDAPNRAGWRYYALSDIGQQLGQLGWLLELADHVPGTEIAIRRNFVPGRWNYRQNGTTDLYNLAHNDQTSTFGFLQDPDHDADVWYVGIYFPDTALGAFILDSGSHSPAEILIDGSTNAPALIPPKSWQFYHVEVPAQTNGQDVIGWELRTTEWSGSLPYMVVRRDQLPEGTGTWHYPRSSTNWVSGNQWTTGSGDWPGYTYDATGTQVYPKYLLSMGMGSPLEPSSYYVGFYNNSSTITGSYSFVSSAIGNGMTYDPQPIPFVGSATITNLLAHDVKYFKIEVPAGQPSWKLRLENTSGETSLYIREGHVPTWSMYKHSTYSPGASFSYMTHLKKTDDEHYLLLPETGATTIPGGTYYLMVVSEGQNPSGNRIGSGSASAVLHSLGNAPVAGLGVIPNPGTISQAGSYNVGEVKLYDFEVPAGVLAMEIRLENRVGNPEMNLRTDTNFPYGASYGSYSGYSPGNTHDSLITLANPAPGHYSLMVNDKNSAASVATGSYTLRIVTVGTTDIVFDGGGDTDVTLVPLSWTYYKVEVPAQTNGQDVIGWELRTTEWSGSRPYMVVRRDQLPEGTGTWYHPRSSTSWASGNQWTTGGGDWSGYSYDATGTQVYPKSLLSMGMDCPLSVGTYYIGFYNNSSSVTGTFSFASSAIGAGMTYDPQPIAFVGSATITNLPAHDVEYFKIEVPAGQPSWKLRLENTSGETSLYIRKGHVPTWSIYQYPNYSPGASFSYMTHLKKTDDEHYLLLPENGATTIPGGTYYLMVASEGQSPSGSTIGSGSASAVLHSLGNASVADLGVLPGAGEKIQADSYNVGEVNRYEFEVPIGVLAMEIRLENRVGNPELNLRTDTNFPYGANYGSYSGYSPAHTHDSLITIANPTPGHYSLMVNDKNSAASVLAGSYTLRIVTVGTTDIVFDGGGDTDVTLAPLSWTYYKVEVPAQTNGQDVIGWELRTTEWSGSRPYMVVRRDQLPEGTGTWYHPRSSTSWASGSQWTTGGGDWSGYFYDSTGTQVYPKSLLSMGMDSPLSVGTYYIGFYNNSSSVTGTFSFASSAIGDGMSYDPQPIAFVGGSTVISNLPAHDVAYCEVEVPNNAASWKVKLENTSGETALYIREGHVPTWSMYQYSNYSPGSSFSYMPRLQKADDEHYLLLPENGATTIPAGTYYLMVVSEGQSPSGSTIGSGSASAILHSLGEEVVIDLGNVPLAGSVDQTNSYEAGEVNLYHFNVQSNSLAIEVRIEDATGDPLMALRKDESLPYGLIYGLYSGYAKEAFDESIITVPNPTPGTWSVIVGDPDNSTSLNNSSYRLVVEEIPPQSLNFDASLNSNESSNVATRLLEDDQRNFYRVDVPSTIEGTPVLGWYLTTSVISGTAHMRVRKDFLPQDSGGGATQTPFKPTAMVVVPPLLTPGTWYVEVKGIGATEYTLVSSAILPERSWAMPSIGGTNMTSGVSDPLFGDSGVNASGIPLPVDQGVDLDSGFYHIYAVTIPDFNAGLLKTQLEAISGNPNLYVRAHHVPTLDHDTNGAGSLYEHRLDSTANTEYGNWVPYDGRYEKQLDPGTWYIMIKAEGGSSARYRLKLSGGNVYPGGNVQTLDLASGSFSGQLLAENDWRHYKVEVPTNAPVNWDITYSQASGNVDLYIRDTVPAGNHTYSSSSYSRDWHDDLKNTGTVRPYFPDTGTHTLNVPPLRPGHSYYLSFLAKSDASFSVSSAVSGGTMPVYEVVDFESGFVSTNIPAGSSITYQVNVPADAVRWIHSTTNASALNVYLEQGSLPSQSTQDHWYKTNGNGSLNKYLLNTTTTWPWRPSYSYFFTVVNPGGAPEPFILVMNGSLAAEIPQNLSATDGSYADRVQLGWSGVSGAGSYEVWRNTTNDVATATNLATTGPNSYYYDYSAEPGQLYNYWVSVGGITNTVWFSSVNSGWRQGIGSITPSQRTHTAEGGSGTINVVASTGTYWNATEGLNWITIQSGSPGTNNGTVVYQVSEYAGSVSRSGSITVAGQTFTVFQDALGLPGNVQATDGAHEDRTVITWDTVLEATRYYIYRNTTNSTGSSSYQGYVTTNIFNDVSGTLGQVYHYWVRPYNAGGTGGFSLPDSGFRSTGVVSPAWRALYFPGGYPGDLVDSDGDGFSNLEEFISDTIPTNGLSYFQIDSQNESPSGFIIHWTSVSGRVYSVNWEESLTNSIQFLDTINYPQGSYTDAVHSAGEQGFYRLEVEMQ